MPDSLVLNIRQIAQYPASTQISDTDVFLIQSGGLGGPYFSASALVLLQYMIAGGGGSGAGGPDSDPYAPLNSPHFTGIPTAPIASPGDNSTQIATTAFVTNAIIAATTGVSSFNTRTGAVVLNQNDIISAGGWASPQFTGVPTAVTAAPGTNTTQLATTAFVTAAIAAAGGGGGPDSDPYLPLTGGVLTGPLAIQAPGTGSILSIDKMSASFSNDIAGNINHLARWLIRLGDNTAEAGSNTGSNFNIWRAGDNGNIIDAPFGISRQFGIVVLGRIANGAGAVDNSNEQVSMRLTNGTYGIYTRSMNSGALVDPMVFTNSANTVVGSIQYNDTTTSYFTSSDARLKEDIRPFDGGRAIIDRLRVRNFKWRDYDVHSIGLVAQEAQDVYPDAVAATSGEPGDEDFRPHGIDYSKYVPLLIEALQHAHRRIDELERKKH